ncbi:MAG: STAS domain-containing protein [Caldilineaceae bacterium]
MASMLTMNVQEEITRIVTLTITARLDAFSAPDYRTQIQTLLEQKVRHLVIDLSATPFLDSAGIAVLVSALKQCRQRGGDVRLVIPQSEAVKRIFELTKFDRVFEMKSSAQEAVASFYR